MRAHRSTHRSTHMRSQEREPHLVRSGGSEIHMDMSEEPLCMENYRKKCTWTCQKSHFVWKFTGKLPVTDAGTHIWGPHILDGSGGTCYKSHFVWKFTRKMPSRISRPAFCVEIYRKNAHGHVRRPILCRNLQEQCRSRISRPTFHIFWHSVWHIF